MITEILMFNLQKLLLINNKLKIVPNLLGTSWLFMEPYFVNNYMHCHLSLKY